MPTSPIQFIFNSSVIVRENNTDATPNRNYVANGIDFANFVDSTDANRVQEQRIQIAPGATQIINLPAGSTKGVAIAFSFNGKVDMQFDYGTVDNTQYGILQGEFTSLSISAPAGPVADTFGTLVILGN